MCGVDESDFVHGGKPAACIGKDDEWCMHAVYFTVGIVTDMKS